MKKNIHTSKCLILNGYQDRAVRISSPNSFIFVFVVSNEGRSFERKVDTRDESLARILDGDGRMKERGDQLEQPRDLGNELQSALKLTVGFLNI